MRLFLPAIFCALLMSPKLNAAAPMVKTQAPAFYRTLIGAFELTALGDGTVDLPMDKLLSGKPDVTKKTLEDHFLKVPTETSVNGYLVNTGSKLVLIDTGAGELFGPTLGKLVTNLKAAGYEPAQVDEIYITHLHPDHVGGLVAKGARVFPNAVVRAHEADAKFWLSQENLSKASEDNKGFFQGAQAAITPYQKEGRFKTFGKEEELTPGIRALPTLGHTLGHTSYQIESQGQKLLILGDLIHVMSVQMAKPEVTIAFDSDPKAAAAARLKVFENVVKEKLLIGAPHLPFPGLGHITGTKKSFEWMPLNYNRM